MHDRKEVVRRMDELMGPVDRQIMMSDSREELLMLACAILQRTTEIFEAELGIEGRKQMYKDYV
jgi:hypothetical protein